MSGPYDFKYYKGLPALVVDMGKDVFDFYYPKSGKRIPIQETYRLEHYYRVVEKLAPMDSGVIDTVSKVQIKSLPDGSVIEDGEGNAWTPEIDYFVIKYRQKVIEVPWLNSSVSRPYLKSDKLYRFVVKNQPQGYTIKKIYEYETDKLIYQSNE